MSRRRLLGTGVSATAGIAGASLLGRSAFAQGSTPVASPAAGDRVLTRDDLQEPLHSYPLVQEKKTFTAMVPSYATEWVDNEMTQWYEERTGVHIEWQVVQSEGAVQQLNLALASGDYPDIIFGFNWSPFELTMSTIGAYGAQGSFVPLNDYLEGNAPHLLTHVSQEYPIAMDVVTLPDGTIYSMPYINDCYHCQFWDQRMWIHSGWLETLGLSMPETTDDLVEVLTAFRDGDPNGNGEQDEYPLTAEAGKSLSTYLVNPFTLSPGSPWLYVDDSGEVTASYLQEGFYQGAEFLAGLTEEGLLDAEAFTRDYDGLRSLGNAPGGSKIGMVPSGWREFIQAVDGEPGEWADYKLMPPLAGPDGARRVDRDFDEPHHGNVFVVTDKCDDPALAVAWADGLYEFEATMRAVDGVPGRDWRFAEDGEIGVDGRPALWTRIPSDPAPEGSNQARTWNQLGPSYRSSSIRLGQAVLAEPELNSEVILYTETKDKLEPYAIGPETDLLRPVFSPEAASRVIELETAITQFVEATFSQIATGQGGPSWEDFQGELQSLGVEEYIQLYEDSQG
jgi:putative aldouronate transport system substrate-binding protein